MNAYEYLQALREALSVLPDEEISSAIRYYEDYFLDAGDENADNVITQLGSPEQVAQTILNEYTGIARRRPEHFDETKNEPIEGVPLDNQNPKPHKKGMNPWVLLAIVLIGIPIGIPILLTLFGLSLAGVATILAVGIAIIVSLIAIPFALCIGGGLMSLFSFLLWDQPFSALATLGSGLICASVGFLLMLLAIKLLIVIIPPVFRAIISAIRWILWKIRNMIKK